VVFARGKRALAPRFAPASALAAARQAAVTVERRNQPASFDSSLYD